MPALLVVALVVVPLAELFVLIQVGQVIGAGWTIGLLVLDSLIGGYLLRREGRRTWVAFRAATTRGSVPANEVADGALVLLGGALMLTPGFLTDVVGLACVVPPTRRVLRRQVLQRGRAASARRSSRASRPSAAGRVVDHEG